MAIFGKPKKTLQERLRELLDEVDKLPEEEGSALWEEIEKRTAGGSADKSGTEEEKSGETSEEIGKAEEDIAEKGADSQSEKDRIDESVAAQEEAKGEEDSQSAKDRVDEAAGEDLREDRLSALESRLNELFEKLSSQFGWNDEDRETAEKAKAVYGLGEGVVGEDTDRGDKAMSKEEIAKTIRKIMN